MTPCARRSLLCWIAFGAAALAFITGRWWLLLVAAGVWFHASRRPRAPRLQVLQGGAEGTQSTGRMSVSNLVAWDAVGAVPGEPNPDFQPITATSASQGPGRSLGCASY